MRKNHLSLLIRLNTNASVGYPFCCLAFVNVGRISLRLFHIKYIMYIAIFDLL